MNACAIDLSQIMEFVLDKEENIVGKGVFPLFPTVFNVSLFRDGCKKFDLAGKGSTHHETIKFDNDENICRSITE